MAIHGLRLSVLICSYALISLAAGEDWWWPSHSSAGASASSSGSGSSSSASASSSSWGGGGSRASASAGSSSGGWGGSSSWASSSAFGSFIALTPGDWCRDGWVGGPEKSCFKVMSTPSTWDQASGFCSELGSRLVALDTDVRTAFVVGLLTTAKLQDSGWWIGGRKIQGEFRWQGAPGVWSAMSFTHWYQGQPDNFQGAEECVEIERKGLTPYGWNDNVCSMKLPFICEATSNNHAGLMS